MKLKQYLQNRTSQIRVLFWILILVVSNQCISNSEYFFDSIVTFEKIEPDTMWAGIENLGDGEYFVSIGKPTAPCDILLDDNLIERGRSTEVGLRNVLVAGTMFGIGNSGNNSHPKKIIIKCEKTAGIPLKFVDKPVLLARNKGIVLHGFRFFLHLLLGPACAILLVMILISSAFWYNNTSKEMIGRITFASVALIHSLSLAYLTRLFLSVKDAYTTHAILRCLFAFTFVSIATGNDKFKVIFRLLAAYSVLSLLGAHFSQMVSVNYTYRVAFILWTLITIVFALYLWNSPLKRASDGMWREAVVIFGTLQAIDASAIFIEVLQPQAPMLLASMCYFVAKQASVDMRKSQRLYRTSYKILNSVNMTSENVETKLQQISEEIHSQNPMLRLSSYVDTYCLGEAIAPRMYMKRLCDFGYRKSTARDLVIDLTSGQGGVMKEALETGKPVFGVGRDGGQFISVPIGNLACINLSDDFSRDPVFGNEARHVLSTLQPAIQTLDGHLKNAADASRFAINRLRDTVGLGTYQTTLGAVFVDIVGYSSLTEKFHDPFRRFISDVYFPALFKNVGQYFTLEFTRGDEAYFCVLDHFLQNSETIGSALREGLKTCWAFQHEVSPRLCEQAGFPPLRLRIGAAIGVGTLSISSIEVKTLGSTVNIAKRLQEDAQEGEILVTTSTSEVLKSPGLYFSTPKRTLIKTTLVESCTLYVETDRKKAGNE